MKPNSLKSNIWLYQIAFTLLIIFFLWFLQIVTINIFYEVGITRQVAQTASLIENTYMESNFLDKEYLDSLSYENDVCIEVERDDQILYSSNSFNRGCVGGEEYKENFKESNTLNNTYRVTNDKLDMKNIVYVSKYDDIYLYVSSPVEPLDATIGILSEMLVIVSIVVIVIAFIVGYIISRRLSKPIEKITEQTKLLAKGNYKFHFEGNKITEINELTKTLNNAKIELEKTDTLRRDLLANVSHDLKTPLTMIKGYAEMIKDFNHNDKEKMFNNLDVIIEETNRLNILVEDILELSKQQNNKDELNMEKFDIVELTNKVVNRFNIFKEDGYIFDIKSPKNSIVIADKKKIEQVLYNLINNAINYTGKNKTILINISKNPKIKVEIIDSGKGIKETELPYIWNKYYHSNKKYQRNKTGTGLGLYIVKTILENHHFRYGVTTKKNNGSTFYFELEK